MNNLYNKDNTSKSTSKYLLLPLIMVFIVVPLFLRGINAKDNLIQFSWYSQVENGFDLFAYWKSVLTIATGAVMLCIALYLVYTKREKIPFSKIYIPVAIYAVLAVLSSIFSKYTSFTLTGIREQFESVFVLLSYCMIAYYCYLVIDSESNLRWVVTCLIIGILGIGAVGFFQFIGHDFVVSKFAFNLLIPASLRNSISNLTLEFGPHRVYSTLYNPNYVGVYVSMTLPILVILLLYAKEWKKIAVYIAGIALSIVCLVGSWSRTGIISLAVTTICLLIIFRKKIFKKWKIVIPLFIAILVLLVVLDRINGGQYSERLINTFKNVGTTETHPLKKVETNEENIKIYYNDLILIADYIIQENQEIGINLEDETGEVIEFHYNEELGRYQLEGEQFQNILMNLVQFEDTEEYGICFRIDGVDWIFSKLEDGYYYYNIYGKFEKIIDSEKAAIPFASFFGERSYIWSTTIPLLKDTILLGTGPDTYAMVYPQADYVGRHNGGYGTILITKPHNIYLQIGVQTGVISLLAFLAFYIMYFISSIRLYWKSELNDYKSQVGAAIFIGTIGFMISGIANDSHISISPIFWGLIGVGIAANYLVKSGQKKETESVA